MRAGIEHVDETPPVAYPTTSPALENNETVWQRLENYCRWRWSPRVVVWYVRGCGYFEPNLLPAAITGAEVWSNRAKEWEAATLDPSPRGGYYLPSTGPWRITATVGGNTTVPAIVWEAAKRLSAFMLAKTGTPGVRSESIHAGSISITRTRDVMSSADAMRQSGAGDLLRGYR